MSKSFALTFLIGLLVIGGVIWAVFLKQEGAHIDPKGSILKVRTLKLDDEHSAAIAEVRLVNTADYALVARSVEMSVTTSKGESEGNIAAEMDVKRLFQYYPVLGEQFNPVLKARDKVPPRSEIDREVCATFKVPVEELDKRKDLIVKVEDITGPTAVIHEKQKK
jgi:hypothetical protein